MTDWKKGMKVVVVMDDGKAGTPMFTTIVLVTGKYVHTDATYKFDVSGPAPTCCGPHLGTTWLLTEEEYEVFKYRKRVYMEMLDALERAPSAWMFPIEFIVAIGDALAIGRPTCLVPEPISFPYEIGWDKDAKPYVREITHDLLLAREAEEMIRVDEELVRDLAARPLTFADTLQGNLDAARKQEDEAIMSELTADARKDHAYIGEKPQCACELTTASFEPRAQYYPELEAQACEEYDA